MALLSAEREQMEDDFPTEYPEIGSHHNICSYHAVSLQ